MKKYNFITIILLSIIMIFLGSCSSDDEQIGATADDYPRIMGSWPERATDGSLGTLTFNAKDTLTVSVQFSPALYCEGTWYVDGVETAKGNTFKFTEDKADRHNLKLVVKTAKNETTREAIIIVNQ